MCRVSFTHAGSILEHEAGGGQSNPPSPASDQGNLIGQHSREWGEGAASAQIKPHPHPFGGGATAYAFILGVA